MKTDKCSEKLNCINTIKHMMHSHKITLTDLKDDMCAWDDDINK